MRFMLVEEGSGLADHRWTVLVTVAEVVVVADGNEGRSHDDPLPSPPLLLIEIQILVGAGIPPPILVYSA